MIRWGYLAYSIPLSGAVGFIFCRSWWAIFAACLVGYACQRFHGRILAAHEIEVRADLAAEIRAKRGEFPAKIGADRSFCHGMGLAADIADRGQQLRAEIDQEGRA